MTEQKTSKQSSEVVIRRFFREIQQSGILAEAKKRRFFEKGPSREKLRQIARRKALIRKEKRGY